jgi:hypothetical protein
MCQMLTWFLSGCESDDDETWTVVIVAAVQDLEGAKKLRVRIASDKKTFELPLKEPLRYRVRPQDDDATRRFLVVAEALTDDNDVLYSSQLTTGYVRGQTRYAKVWVKACTLPIDMKQPSELARSESELDPTGTQCLGNTAEGGAGGAAGKAGAGAGGGPVGKGGAGGGGGDAGLRAGGRGGAGAGGRGGADGAGVGGAGVGGVSGPLGVGGNDVAKQMCGDKQVTGSEQCDIGIAAGGPGACPVQCPASEGCNHSELVGELCLVRCETATITQAIRDDKCCPKGANANTDNDCPPRCGNGATEADETCDSVETCASITAICNSVSRCLLGVLTGEAAKCNLKCEPKEVSDCASGDGCCPGPCTNATDTDCSVKCGDGVIGAGESCEPQSADKPCPTSCDDGKLCTQDLLTGKLESCTAACEHVAITAPKPGDGCCPNGANANTDDDCTPRCDNGVVESSEQCDGHTCPADVAACHDNDVCTRDELIGLACQRRCTNTRIMAPTVTVDGCCPVGANSTVDVDCNILSGKLFEASLPDSTDTPGFPIQNVTDGDDTTRWISTAMSPVDVTADLGGTYTLSRVAIYWAGDTISTFTLQISSDRARWTTILSGKTSGVMQDSSEYSEFSAPATGRYFRIHGTGRWNTVFGNSIYEVRAYGTYNPQ